MGDTDILVLVNRLLVRLEQEDAADSSGEGVAIVGDVLHDAVQAELRRRARDGVALKRGSDNAAAIAYGGGPAAHRKPIAVAVRRPCENIVPHGQRVDCIAIVETDAANSIGHRDVAVLDGHVVHRAAARLEVDGAGATATRIDLESAHDDVVRRAVDHVRRGTIEPYRRVLCGNACCAVDPGLSRAVILPA